MGPNLAPAGICRACRMLKVVERRAASPASVNTKSSALIGMHWIGATFEFGFGPLPDRIAVFPMLDQPAEKANRFDARQLAIYTVEESIRSRHSVAGAPISSRCACAAARCTSRLPNCRPASNAVRRSEISCALRTPSIA